MKQCANISNIPSFISFDKMASLKTKKLEDGRIELSGGTFPLRDQIKARGGKWDPARKVWIMPIGTSLDFEVSKPKTREEWTREEWQTWISAFKIRNRGRVEQCCSHAEDISDMYGPREYKCEHHGETRGSYRGD